ncbi:MAG: hypothetical protein KDB01_02795, partial [Planctomycetaceae bacterium]|nr:hypothetical protein [Planctomycetaceae bacterium]
MPVSTPVHDRLNELLTASVDAWLEQRSWTGIHGHWRGTGSLLDFAEQFPTLKSQQTASAYPNCVVMAEYGRFTLSDDGSDNAIDLLIDGAQQILAGRDIGTHGNHINNVIRLVRAMTHTALAAVAYKQHDNAALCEHMRLAADHYDRAAALTSLRTAKAPMKLVAPDMASGDLSSGDTALHVLQIAERCGIFGVDGITISTWLMLHRLLAHVLGVVDPEPLFMNDLKVLLVGGPRGVIQPIRMEKRDAVNSGVYFDPLSFGVTVINRSMRNSLKVAWRCCRQTQIAPEIAAIRITADLPELLGSLAGGSAGGLFAAGTIATAREQQLDSTRSATCQLVITDAVRDQDETLPLHPEDLSLKFVGGVIRKINEAWQVEHGIDEVLLCPSDAAAWRKANPNCTRPVITDVSSLHELVERLTGNRRYDREIERHARMVHGQWDRVKAAIRFDNSREVDRDHRFDCYVDPTFRVEGPLRPIEKMDAAEQPQQSRVRATGVEREEFIAPGVKDDEQLLNLLELSLRGTLWPDAPSWLKPGRSLVFYDVAGAGKTVCSHRLLNLLTNPKHFKRLLIRPA